MPDFPVIEPEDREAVYLPDEDATEIPVPFHFQRGGDIEVAIETGAGSGSFAALVQPDDCSVEGALDPDGGTVTLAEPADGLLRYRVRGLAAIDRLASVIRGGRFDSQILDAEIARNRIIAQELRRDAGRPRSSWFPAFALLDADMTSTDDQPFAATAHFPDYANGYLLAVLIARWRSGAASALTAGGVYSGAGKTGHAWIAASASYANLSGAGKIVLVTQTTAAQQNLATGLPILSLSVGSATPCRADLFVQARPLFI